MVYENVGLWSLACQQSVFRWYHSNKHFSEFYPQDGDNGDSDVISFRSLSIPGGFRRHLVGKTLRNVCYSTVT